MKKSLFVSILIVLMGGFFALSVIADNNRHDRQDNILVKFKGGIGVIPISNVVVDATTGAVTSVNRNIVRGVNSPGQIWRIADLKVIVKVNGHIRAAGQGLLLAGGNSIGTNANQSVRARLFCDTAVHESKLVALEANGVFKIDDILVPVSSTDPAVPPNPCTNPVLLIVNSGGNWFAAGIPDLDDHHRD